MYYTHRCTYCTKIFYTFHDSRIEAAKIMYRGIKTHLQYYDEDRKEYEMDESFEKEVDKMYREMEELNEPPSGGYPLE